MAEYNAFTAAQAIKDPAQQIKALDDFVSKYPNSALLIYVYPLYYNAYSQLKNFPKVMENADKRLALGDKLEPAVRYQAYYARAFAYSNINPPPTDADLNKKARQAALDGLKTLNDLKKPDNMTQEQIRHAEEAADDFVQLHRGEHGDAAEGLCRGDRVLQGSAEADARRYDDQLPHRPVVHVDDAAADHGRVLGLWRARSAQGRESRSRSTQVKTYLRKLIANYQQAACDNLIDAEMNELLQLSASSPDKPSSYTLPSSADLDAARKDMTIASVITDLKAGGDKSKITWLAACGLEFPDVPGKLIEVTPGTTQCN